MIISGAYGDSGSFVRQRNTRGNLIWSYETRIRYSSPAIVGNNWIIFGTTDGWLEVLNDSGNLCYQHFCGGNLTSPAIGWHQSQGAIYIASDRGKVYKFGSSGVGIEEGNISKMTQIKCFPNPFKDALNIDLDKEQTVEIFDATGREVFSQRGQRIIWSAQTVPAGIYFIQIGDKQHKKVRKLK